MGDLLFFINYLTNCEEETRTSDLTKWENSHIIKTVPSG